MRRERQMDRSKLNIGTYYLAPYASTEEHVKQLAECGINMVVNMRCDPQVLDLFCKYDIGAIVSGVLPGWFGGNGSNAGTMNSVNPIEKYDSASITFEDHPAIWGIDTGDEPSSWDFPHYGEIFRRVEDGFNGALPYLNIYPSYGVKGDNTREEIIEQLGTQNYKEYIEEFCVCVRSDYISVDYYLYSANIRGFYETLSVVSDACLRTKRQMWVVLQVNSHREDVWISTNQLRFQAYTALVFGAEVINWACYTAGWWFNHVLDKQGNKTKQYERLKEVNAEIHALSDAYMKYQYAETHFVGDFTEEELCGTDAIAELTFSTNHFHDLKVSGGHKLLVGVRKLRNQKDCMADYKEALMLVSADDPYDEGEKVSCITFRTERKKIKALGRADMTPLTLCEDGTYLLMIRSNEGILLIEE